MEYGLIVCTDEQISTLVIEQFFYDENVLDFDEAITNPEIGKTLKNNTWRIAWETNSTYDVIINKDYGLCSNVDLSEDDISNICWNVAGVFTAKGIDISIFGIDEDDVRKFTDKEWNKLL